MLSRVSSESFLRMFPPALLHFPICLKVTPSYAAVCRREDASGSFWAFSPGGDLLDADSMGQAQLDRFTASGFRGLLVCPLCAERAALDKRRQDFIHIAAPAVSHTADAARFRRRRIRVSSLIMRISIITSIFNNNGYLHIIEYLH